MSSCMLRRVFTDRSAGLTTFYCQISSSFSSQGLIDCFELNILYDLKVADFIKFSLCSKQFLLRF